MRKYCYGDVMKTEAIVATIEECTGELLYLKHVRKKTQLKKETETSSELIFTYEMSDETIVYGLGENVRGINKRGHRYISQCSDDPSHTEDKESLYGAHNFLLISGAETFGIFIDFPGKITFDIGYTCYHTLQIEIEESNADIYIIEGRTEQEIITKFRKAIGKSYIPPKWAFGYGQSRWSYYSQEEVEAVVEAHRKNKIPLDSVYLDIDYMDHYKDFTVNSETFPDLSAFAKKMKQKGIHLVPIIDAGVKIEEGYETYEEGVANQYFCKNEDGSDYVAGVWPGRVHFPDVLKKEAREWFGNKYKVLLDQGIDGFWNDMNEPAIFYSEERLKEVLSSMQEYQDKNLDLDMFWKFKGSVNELSNNVEDYKLFFHEIDGKKISHDKVHNLYGFQMTKAAGEAFLALKEEERILLFSRASYIGMHRYGGIWTGDNISIWSHLLLNIKMMPSLNMCGFLFSGADIGGFGGNTTEDLMLRWLAFGIFTPLMRNHSALGTRRQEVYQFENLPAFRNIITLRYALLPYIYSEFVKAARLDGMLFKPLGFVFTQDDFARRVEDQLFYGESIMLTPVYEQNAKGRYVYLPERMKFMKMKTVDDYVEEIMEKGHHFIEVAIDEVPFFIRENHIVPISKGGENVEEVDYKNLTLLHYVTTQATYELYNDDGYHKEYEKGLVFETIQVKSEEK